MSKERLYTKELGMAVARRAKGGRNYHVISKDLVRWSVVLEGTTKSIRIFIKKEDALDFARKFAKSHTKASTDEPMIIVHDRMGAVSKKIAV
jgi:hypothetical protein